MESWTIPSFVLSWLKENLDGYQFLTPAAKQLRDEMVKNRLESDEDFRQFGALYDQFLSMIETNPLTKKNRDKKDAEILANDFYFFFFPTKQDVYLPIGLYIEIGAVNPQDAQSLRDRMLQAYYRWKNELESSKQQTREEVDSLSERGDLQQLISKTPSKVKYIVSQAFILILALLCIAGDFYLYYHDNDHILKSLQSLRSLETPLNLTGIVFIVIFVVSAIYLVCSIIWIVHERKRERFLSAWKSITLDIQEKRKRTADFRDPDNLKRTIERIGLQTLGKGKTYSRRRGLGASDLDKKKQIKIEDFDQPKNRNLFQTARPVHVFAMLMLTICLFVLAGENNPGPLKKLYASAKSRAQYAAMFLNDAAKGTDDSFKETDDSSPSVELQLIQTKNTKGYSKIGDDDSSVTFTKKYPLNVLSREEGKGENDVWYHVEGKAKDTETGDKAYVKFNANKHSLIAKNQVKISDKSWKDKNGNEKDINDLNNLFDGNPKTSADLKTDDIIEINFPKEVTLSGMYILNGKTDNDKNVQNIYFKDQDQKWKVISLKEGDNIVDLSSAVGSTDRLEIRIGSIMDESDDCSISEIIFVEQPETESESDTAEEEEAN